MIRGYWYSQAGELLVRIDAGPHATFASAMCTSAGRGTCAPLIESWQVRGVPSVDGVKALRQNGSFYAIRDVVIRAGGRWIHVDDTDELLWHAITTAASTFDDRVAMFADLQRGSSTQRASAIAALQGLGTS